MKVLKGFFFVRKVIKVILKITKVLRNVREKSKLMGLLF